MSILPQPTPPASTTGAASIQDSCPARVETMPWHWRDSDEPAFPTYQDFVHSEWDALVRATAEHPDPDSWPRRHARGDWPAPRSCDLRVRKLYWLARRDGLRCRYCGSGLCPCQATIDHLTPTSRGGSSTPANLGLACLSCNARKGARTEVEFCGATA